MKITKFEEFLESAVPLFLIGLIVFILFLVFSCGEPETESQKEDPAKNKRGGGMNFSWEVVTIDGCEYIARYQAGVVHKANCKNHKPCE